RRQHRQVISQLLCTDVVADGAPLGGVDAVVLDVVELDVIQVHDGLRHVFLRTPSTNSACMPSAKRESLRMRICRRGVLSRWAARQPGGSTGPRSSARKSTRT